jgi:uncharacterized membrane protein
MPIAMLVAGVLCLLVGFVATRGQPGRPFFAAPLAVFGVQHLTQPQAIMQVVPVFMPFRIFWVYLVGIALIAAALSIATGKYLRLAGLLLGCMWLGFVLLIHIPNVILQPDRFMAALVGRDLAFGVAAWTLVGNQRLTTASRIIFGVLILFFGIEHLLHPEFAPGVPLRIMTPESIPIRAVWGYAIGAMLLATGVALLIQWHTRVVATWLGVAVTVAVVVIYVPMLLAAPRSGWVLPIDAIFDTLLFAGSALLIAWAMPREARIVDAETFP